MLALKRPSVIAALNRAVSGGVLEEGCCILSWGGLSPLILGDTDVNLHVGLCKLTGIFVFYCCLYEVNSYDRLSMFERNPLLPSSELAHIQVYVHASSF